MKWHDWYISILALVVWREARNQGYDGMRAVAHVIRNRVLATNLPDQWEDVIQRKWQFSSLTAVGDSQLIQWPKQPDQAFEQAMDIATRIIADPCDDFDLTNGATHYFADSIPMPDWAKTMIETIKIKNHTFYKGGTR